MGTDYQIEIMIIFLIQKYYSLQKVFPVLKESEDIQ